MEKDTPSTFYTHTYTHTHTHTHTHTRLIWSFSVFIHDVTF